MKTKLKEEEHDITLLKSNKCTPSTIGKKVLVGALTATLAVVANLALPDSISLGGFDLGVLTAQASEDVTVGDYTYTIDNGTAVLSSYNGTSSSVTVPTSMTYNGVTYKIRSIGANAFEGNQYIESLVIPDGITSIGNAAFKNCTSLSSITINGNIGDCNSYSTSTNSYHYYSNYSVFYNVGANADSLTVTFGSNVTYVPAYLFATASSQTDGVYPHITSVVFSDSVSEVGSYAFYHCYDLKELDMGGGLTTIDSYAFFDCYSLSDIKWGSSLTTIGSYAFAYNYAQTELTLPSKLTYINDHAFIGCTGLTSITLPESTTSLGNCAFKDCTGLSSIIINGNIGDCNSYSVSTNSYHYYSDYSVFYNAGANADSLTVTFGGSATYVPAYLFATASSQSDGVYPHITSVVLSDSMSEVGSYAFYHCYNLNELDMGDGLKTIYSYAFYDCSSLKTLVMGSGLIEIGGYAFSNCTSLATVTWGTNLTTIGSYAFYGDTALTSMNLPSNLVYIQEHAFDSCTKLASVILPSSTTSLGKCAFKNCTALSSLTINGNIGDCDSYSTSTNSYHYYSDYSVFYNAGANADSLTVTFGSNVTYVPAYLFATASSQSDSVYPHITSVVFSDSMSEVGSYAFYHCYDLKELDMGGGLTTIDSYAFFDCYSLSDIKWGSSLTTIGSYAFAYNFAQTELTLPSKVTYINDHAFIGCTSLTSITLPESTTSLGNCVFKDCTGLSSITINGNIGDCNGYSASTNSYHYYSDYSVFYNAGANTDSLTVTFGSNVTYVPAYLFATASAQSDGYYAHVTSVVLSDSVTGIGTKAFYDCYDLKELKGGNGLTSIGSEAFYNCSSLASIEISDALTDLSEDAFNNCSSLKDVYFTGTENKWNVLVTNGVSDCLTTATVHYIVKSYDLSQCTVTLEYNTETISSGFTCSPTTLSAAGTQEISVTYEGITATFVVTVNTPSIAISQASLSLSVGEAAALSAAPAPGGDVSWSSSDPNVVTVSGGTVTAVGSGSANITASFTYGGNEYSATCAVTVYNPVTVTYNANGGYNSYNGNTISSANINSGDGISYFPDFFRYGYVLDGWYTSPSGGTLYSSGTPIYEDITLYAHWSVDTYPDEYNSIITAYFYGIGDTMYLDIPILKGAGIASGDVCIMYDANYLTVSAEPGDIAASIDTTTSGQINVSFTSSSEVSGTLLLVTFKAKQDISDMTVWDLLDFSSIYSSFSDVSGNEINTHGGSSTIYGHGDFSYGHLSID